MGAECPVCLRALGPLRCGISDPKDGLCHSGEECFAQGYSRLQRELASTTEALMKACHELAALKSVSGMTTVVPGRVYLLADPVGLSGGR